MASSGSRAKKPCRAKRGTDTGRVFAGLQFPMPAALAGNLAAALGVQRHTLELPEHEQLVAHLPAGRTL